MVDRRPAVAGTFYEARPERLRAQVQQCFDVNPVTRPPAPFIGAVVPHAGLIYSGHVAAAAYRELELPDRLVILCPNHTGYGKPAAINREGSWITPLGAVPVDSELADELMEEEPALEEDQAAHAREHSLEVQLPFLQVLHPGLRFVPICVARHSYEFCSRIGEAIARVIERHRARGERIAMIASSDMNHYETQEETLRKDQLAIDRLLALDSEGLWKTVGSQDISMCGILPAVSMLTAAKRLGATEARLVKHATSGDVNGDYGAVVGYASIVISGSN